MKVSYKRRSDRRLAEETGELAPLPRRVSWFYLLPLELVAYWREAPKADKGEWLRFGALVALTLEIEVIVALWISGALRPA